MVWFNVCKCPCLIECRHKVFVARTAIDCIDMQPQNSSQTDAFLDLVFVINQKEMGKHLSTLLLHLHLQAKYVGYHNFVYTLIRLWSH